MNLNDQIKNVNYMLSELLKTQESELKKVEDITLGIIAEDDFGTLPDKVQDAIYLLNNYELENPSLSDFTKVVQVLNQYIDNK